MLTLHPHKGSAYHSACKYCIYFSAGISFIPLIHNVQKWSEITVRLIGTINVVIDSNETHSLFRYGLTFDRSFRSSSFCFRPQDFSTTSILPLMPLPRLTPILPPVRMPILPLHQDVSSLSVPTASPSPRGPLITCSLTPWFTGIRIPPIFPNR